MWRADAIMQDLKYGRRGQLRGSQVGVDGRTVKKLRFALLVGIVGAFGLVTVVSAAARTEVMHAADILAKGNTDALRDYILSFGAWAPIVSTVLMLFQALAAPLPAFVLAFVNGLAFGLWWGGLLTMGSDYGSRAVVRDRARAWPAHSRGHGRGVGARAGGPGVCPMGRVGRADRTADPDRVRRRDLLCGRPDAHPPCAVSGGHDHRHGTGHVRIHVLGLSHARTLALSSARFRSNRRDCRNRGVAPVFPTPAAVAERRPPVGASAAGMKKQHDVDNS